MSAGYFCATYTGVAGWLIANGPALLFLAGLLIGVTLTFFAFPPRRP
jgi:hypothetical protein